MLPIPKGSGGQIRSFSCYKTQSTSVVSTSTGGNGGKIRKPNERSTAGVQPKSGRSLTRKRFESSTIRPGLLCSADYSHGDICSPVAEQQAFIFCRGYSFAISAM